MRRKPFRRVLDQVAILIRGLPRPASRLWRGEGVLARGFGAGACTDGLPALGFRRGFEAIYGSGPAYLEEHVRPVVALVVRGEPRLLLACGPWQRGRFGQYGVPRGTDFLEPVREERYYVGAAEAASDKSYPILWADAVKETPMPRCNERRRDPCAEAETADDFLHCANRCVNSVAYAFLGRKPNEWLFSADGHELSLIERMLDHLDYLKSVYAADREAIGAWRRERLEASDAFAAMIGRHVAGVGVRPEDTIEWRRWEAIRDADPLSYRPR